MITWFKRLNSTFLTKGTSKIFWKIHGKDRTIGVDEDLILKNLKQGLKSNNKSYIYHCYNHYLCILGFESTPSKPHEAYEKNLQILEKEEWIILGEVSKCYPGLLMKKWKDVVIDLNCQFPEYFNIRKSELGIQKKSGKNFNEGKYLGGNLHCIIEFSKNN